MMKNIFTIPIRIFQQEHFLTAKTQNESLYWFAYSPEGLTIALSRNNGALYVHSPQTSCQMPSH